MLFRFPRILERGEIEEIQVLVSKSYARSCNLETDVEGISFKKFDERMVYKLELGKRYRGV